MKQFLLTLLTTTCLLGTVSQATAQTVTPTKQWDKTFGGSLEDVLTTLQQTSDGGYILGGQSLSTSSGDKTQPGHGQLDYWVVKVDASGTKQWDKTFGGNREDFFYSLQQTSDGGYILGGYSFSPISGDKTQGQRGFSDYWIVKLDASGTKQWDRTYGTNDNDFLQSVRQTSDGGYILAGTSYADIDGDKTQASRGDLDYWVIKVDANGTKQWDRTLGSASIDVLNALQQTSDGGYILGGYARSAISGDKTQPNRGLQDYWVVKVDASGTKQWDKTFGTSARDYFTSLQQTSDGGYILGGQSDSPISGDKTQPSQGQEDYWVVKLDASGAKQWDMALGGSTYDNLYSLRQTNDGGYVLGGTSGSNVSGDKTQPSQGGSDYWIVKLGATPLATTAATTRPALSAYPNPTRSQLTLRGPLGTPYQLLNQVGQVVRAGKLSAQPLDVHTLPAGLYLLRDSATGRTTKLVKE